MIRVTRQKFSDIRCVRCDLEEGLPFEPSSFDLGAWTDIHHHRWADYEAGRQAAAFREISGPTAAANNWTPQ